MFHKFLYLVVGIFIQQVSGGLFWSDETTLPPNAVCGEDLQECDYSLDNMMLDDFDSSGGEIIPPNNYYGNENQYYYPPNIGYTSGQAQDGSFITPQQQNQGYNKRQQQANFFNENDLVGLHPHLPIGSYVLVQHPELGTSVVVRIIGRPVNLSFGRCMTLSKAAFAQIANLGDGTIHCVVTAT